MSSMVITRCGRALGAPKGPIIDTRLNPDFGPVTTSEEKFLQHAVGRRMFIHSALLEFINTSFNRNVSHFCFCLQVFYRHAFFALLEGVALS